MTQSQSIDIEEYLKDNKLGEVADIFVKRNITIEEILEFDTQDLRSFARDIGLDTLQQNRFVKAINNLKPSSPSIPDQQQKQSIPPTTDVSVQKQQQTVSQLPSGWEMCYNNDGRIFYQNNITKTTQWERPTESSIDPSRNSARYEIKQQPSSPSPIQQQTQSVPPTTDVSVQKEQQTVGPLPSGWEMCYNNDGRVFYQNNFTKKTQWERPAESSIRGYEIKQQHVDSLKVARAATCICGSVVCGIINLTLGFVAWILTVLAALFFYTPIPQILGFLAILIFLISNTVASIVGGLCGGLCCSNSLRMGAWGLFGFSCVAALVVIGGSFVCYGDCTEYRTAGAVIGTMFFISTILFVIDNCKNARNINHQDDNRLDYKLLE